MLNIAANADGSRRKKFEDPILLRQDVRTPKFKSVHFYCVTIYEEQPWNYLLWATRHLFSSTQVGIIVSQLTTTHLHIYVYTFKVYFILSPKYL
jgi:hypothetical protein